MNPLILYTGLISFCAALLLHIFVWRARRPKNDILALLVIFVMIPSAAAAVGFWARAGLGLEFWDFAAILVLHLALSAMYIQSYPPAQAVSPSLQILIYVGQSADGLTKEEILSLFDDAKMVAIRFQDLIHTRLIEQKDESYQLAPAGKRLIGFFVAYRKLLGLEFKGG